jgi:hypothetical protein
MVKSAANQSKPNNRGGPQNSIESKKTDRTLIDALSEVTGMADFAKLSVKYILFTLTIVSFACIDPTSSLAESEGIPEYLGSLACKPCHEKEYRNFMTHAKKSTSFKSIERVKKELTEKEIRGCYYCHTTGYGKPGGFISPEKTPHLKNAGCEVCHGPGEFHVKEKDPSFIKRRLTAEDCEVCHTSERVRAFRYKPLIHGGAH